MERIVGFLAIILVPVSLAAVAAILRKNSERQRFHRILEGSKNMKGLRAIVAVSL
jgi:hypothetical protein